MGVGVGNIKCFRQKCFGRILRGFIGGLCGDLCGLLEWPRQNRIDRFGIRSFGFRFGLRL